MINKNDCLKLTNLIDEKYVDEALALKPKKENAVKQKIDKKINFKKPILALLSVAVILAVVVLPIASTIKTPNNTLQNSTSNSVDIGDGFMLPSVRNVYMVTETSSFALVELQSIVGILSEDVDDKDNNCVMAQFKVIEDYYENLAEEKIINIPLRIPSIDKNNYLNAELFQQFIESYNHAFIYINSIDGQKTWYKNGDKNDSVNFDFVSNTLNVSYYYIPIKDNAVQSEVVKNFLKNNNCLYNNYLCDFDIFFKQGLSVEDAKNNIRAIYNDVVSGDYTPQGTPNNGEIDY